MVIDKKKLFLDYYRANINMYVDNVVEYSKYTHVNSRLLDDGYWNFMCFLEAKDHYNFFRIYDSQKYVFENKDHYFYFLDFEEIYQNLDTFYQKYKVYSRDTWFYTPISELNLSYKSDLPIKTMESLNQTSVIGTMIKGFLPNGYKIALETKWGFSQNNFHTYHYCAYINGAPIGVVSVTIKDKVAYLNNLITLPQYKGHGIAKQLLCYALQDCLDKKVDNVFVKAETDSYSEQFYLGVGFKPLMHGIAFKKDKMIDL